MSLTRVVCLYNGVTWFRLADSDKSRQRPEPTATQYSCLYRRIHEASLVARSVSGCTRNAQTTTRLNLRLDDTQRICDLHHDRS